MAIRRSLNLAYVYATLASYRCWHLVGCVFFSISSLLANKLGVRQDGKIARGGVIYAQRLQYFVYKYIPFLLLNESPVVQENVLL